MPPAVIRLRSFVIALALLSTLSVRAAAQASVNKQSFVTVNPLGLLQFGPTLEFERLVSPEVGVAFGVRVPTLGLLAHVIDPDIGFAILGMAELRFHSDSRRPMGWWWGPRGEFGKSNSAGTLYTVYGGGLEVGHNRTLKSGRLLSAGAIGGMFKSTSSLQGIFVMGVLSLGLSR